MTVALISIAWGDRYARFVPRWWEMAQRLNPAPDEIVIAHHPDDDTGVLGLPVTLVECRDRSLPRMLNAAITATSSTWIQQCPLDDMLTVDALQPVSMVRPDTDLIVVGATSMNSGTTWTGDFGSIWGPSSGYRMNHHCPIRRDLWERVGGYGDEHWSDWGFFLRAAAAQASPEYVDRVTLLFDDTHDGRYSNRGGPHADQEIRDLQARFS